MSIIHAVYENGVFRPIEPVDLPEHARVEFEPKLLEDEAFIQAKIEELQRTNPSLAAVYEVLSRRFESGEPGNILETHNDHQP